MCLDLSHPDRDFKERDICQEIQLINQLLGQNSQKHGTKDILNVQKESCYSL